MKTINYTGNSKLISRIVHLLNRKAPLPLDGDGDAVWGTNGQVLTTDGNGNTSWTTPQGGGGDVTDVEVNGTSVVNAQGVAEVTVPTNTSDLNNDSGFITNLVNDLANYYTKSQTYTQAEVNALISGIVTLNILVVQTLPTQDISTTTIYLVPKQDAGTDDIYDEYLYINNAWELIGTTQIDLSNYVTTTDLSTALADYVTSVGLATILADYVQSSDLGNGTITIQKNGTTVDTFTTNQSANKTVNITVTEGHNIWNRIKTALTSRVALWFADASVSDASADGATKVEVVTELSSESDFDNLATDGTADGIYSFPDSGEEYLTADNVGYDGGTVEEMLDGKVLVSVTADGVKTYATLLNELYTSLNVSDLTPKSVLRVGTAISRLANISASNELIFSVLLGGSVNMFQATYTLGASSTYWNASISSSGFTSTDRSASVPSSGLVITIYK